MNRQPTPPACARVEDRLSDDQEGALTLAERAEVREHLESCARCRELSEALADVLQALHGAREAVEPAPDLAERVAAAALRAAWVARASRQWLPSPLTLTWVRGLAAVLAVATTAALFLAPSVAAQPPRVFDSTARMGAYLAERRANLFEDLRLLRVVIATAFEGRFDRVNDRMEDYRRLIERRREAQEPGPTPAPRSGGRQRRPSFPNFAAHGRVDMGVKTAPAAQRSM